MFLVKPRKAPKTSSKGYATLRALEAAPSLHERILILAQSRDGFFDFPELTKAKIHRDYMRRRELLIDLANLHDEGYDWFRRKWARHQNIPTKADVIKLRNELREVWQFSLESNLHQRIVASWFYWRPSSSVAGPANASSIAGMPMWIPVLATGTIVPVFDSLPAQLVQGVLEHYGRFGTCENPNCPARFVLVKRFDQKYCERGECTVYAQRQYALKWWNREGKTLREQKSRKAKGKRR
jgi:hypothetical protein